jgi:hypothetical protein
MTFPRKVTMNVTKCIFTNQSKCSMFVMIEYVLSIPEQIAEELLFKSMVAIYGV